MGWEAWTSIGVVVAVIVLLTTTRIGPDLILLGGLLFLMTAGVVSPADALAGMTNEGMVTVGILFVVAAGIYQAGGMNLLAERLLGHPKSIIWAQLRVMLPVTALSGFLNNTPVVAMFIPTITEWVRKHDLAASKFMIPLSYAAIFGGACTLIGTSTNLVVNGMLIEALGSPGLRMFDIALIGVPCAVAGIGYMVLVSQKLLPQRGPIRSQLSDPREYTVEMLVNPGSPLIGKTIEQAGLRHLSGLYLMEIDREDELIFGVGPEERLHAGDRLVFVGIVESVIDLQRMRGLVPATDQVFKLDAPRSSRRLVEAVVSNTCPLLGQSIRESRFRTRYDAVVLGVARNGERIRQKIGDIVLKVGDTLLLEAHESFVSRQRNTRSFFLVSQVDDAAPPRHEKAWVAMAILALMVVVASAGWMSILNAAALAAAVLLVTRCLTGTEARRSIDWQVLLVIIAAFGIGRALQITGASEFIAGGLIGLAGDHPWLVLAMVYGVTSLFTSVITNNAAAILVFPIAMATADRLGVSYMPFIMTIMMAASASFATPIGYQTNLMVYGPGGYRFSDFLRIGLPLNVLMWGITVALAPLIWKF
jgi:di/tricarboxylate transporter